MIRSALRRFMYGRYGNDHLNHFLSLVFLILILIYTFTSFALLYWLALVPFFLFVFRFFSRNLPQRREENARFLKAATPPVRWWRLRRTMRKDKEHRYFKCPNCGQRLRVPRGRGRVTVTCRSCNASFEEKS